jgi:hypothetical protein
MSNREAIDTITGYFYQFDKTILELLSLENNSESICIEGIEDIDVIGAGSTSAVQCKYYAKTEYTPSVIKKPIKLMLEHFAKNKESGIQYHIYGHYKSGQDKFKNLTLELLKLKFLTSKKTQVNPKTDKSEKVLYEAHKELGLSDNDLRRFLSLLSIDVDAPSISTQYENIITSLQANLKATEIEAELYHYNAALKLIKNLSLKQDKAERVITKCDFINQIKRKDEIFDSWFIRRKGRDLYIKTIKKAKLINGLNMEAYERFFLLDCTGLTSLPEIKEIIHAIAKKWSKVSKRQKPTFCPSIYLHGIDLHLLLDLKNEMYSEGSIFVDGYPFTGASLSASQFFVEPTLDNKISFRVVNDLQDLSVLIESATKNVEVYMFYIKSTFFKSSKVKVENIKVEDISYIKDMVK